MLFAGKKWCQINCYLCFKTALNPCSHLNEGCFIYFNYDTFRYWCKNSVLTKFRETVQYYDLHYSEIDFKCNRQPPGKNIKLGQILAVQLQLLIISYKIIYVIKSFKLCKQH